VRKESTGVGRERGHKDVIEGVKRDIFQNSHIGHDRGSPKIVILDLTKGKQLVKVNAIIFKVEGEDR